MSFASVTTSAISLFALGVFLVLSANLDYILVKVESNVGVTAYLSDEVSAERVRELRDMVATIDGVTSVKFVSKEEALQRLKDQFGEHSDLLEAVEESNPLRNSLEIQVKKPEYVQEIAGRLRQLAGVAEVEERADLMKRLSNTLLVTRCIGLGLIAILSVASVLVISNTVRLSVIARRREVAIMKIVGATDGFIRWPFFMEGMVLGLIGSGLAGLALWYGYSVATREVMRLVPFLPILPEEYLIPRVDGILLGAGALVGAVGSSWSLRRYLRV
ncbi:MAG TPA: ABC transporter permease [Clostridia bacterium]|nr:ABC transporter permease [Clostridia bacterium]